MRKLYLFDFDGTLTKKDTMFLFLKFYDAEKFRWQFVKHIPIFVLLKLKLAKPDKVKKSLIASILKGESQINIEKKANDFFQKFHHELMRETAVDFLKNRDKNSESCLVTASLDIWTKPFADFYGMKLLATKAEFANGIFTGDFASPNCNGAEKVRRISKFCEGKTYDKIIAFGDTSGDLPMLEWATEGHFKFFHQ